MRRIRRLTWIPALILAGVHTCLVVAAAYIQYGPGWDDMSPTMLIGLGLYLADYPLVKLAQQLQILGPSSQAGFLYLGCCGGAMWGMIGAGVGAGLGALFSRRARPGHCEMCGYDLTGNTSGRCPECGQATASIPTPNIGKD